MLITDFSIKRPVFAVALSMIIVLVGLLSLQLLSLQHYPEVEEPTLTVSTQYRGASPYIVESKVTNVLEQQFGGLTGIDYIQSESKTARSEIFLHFKEGTKVADAAADVRERIAQVRDRLPEAVKDPVIQKSNAHDRMFMTLAFQSSTMDDLEIYDYVDRYVRGNLEAIPGVAECELWGTPYSMLVNLDREKLKAYNITVPDALREMKDSGEDAPAGTIIKGGRYVGLMAVTAMNTPERMGEMVLKSDEGQVVYLKDVAEISLGKDDNGGAWQPRLDKKEAVFAGLKKMSGGNMLEISNRVQQVLGQIQDSLPDGMTVQLGYNFSLFIEASLKAVKSTIFEAMVLVLLIIFFFLRSGRAAVIPLMTIPISLIGSFAFLYAFGCSINTLTLLAMVLAIGLVVDDAIVVLENIHRHIEKGAKPLDAALKGSREVGFAVIAMTLTLASVYAPIAFVHGMTGQLFAEFAVALAGAVLVSGVVALTLSPMMCSLLLKSHTKEARWSQVIDGWITALEYGYKKALNWVLTSAKATCGVIVLALVSATLLFNQLPKELAPQEDQGIIMSWTQGPNGATVENMLQYTTQLEAIFSELPEAKAVFSATMPSGVFAGVALTDWSERDRSQAQALQQVRQKTQKIPGAQVFAFPMKTILSGGQGGVQIAIKTTGELGELEDEMNALVAELRKLPYYESVRHDLMLSTPQLNVHVDREKAAIAEVKVKDVNDTLETMLGGTNPITFEMKGKHYDVIVQARPEDRRSIQDVDGYFVKSEIDMQNPELVPVSHFVKLEEIAIPSEVKHFGKMRAAMIEADLKPGQDLATALEATKAVIKNTLPSNMQMEYAGHMREFFQSQSAMYLIFGAALMFIYLVLAIQFNSFLDPLLILVTVPLSMTGALLALYLTGCSLNIFSQVGLITLVGLITKHGILIVEFANKRVEAGKSAIEAVKEAAGLRLRPILMTTGAMVLGAIPLALAVGAGAESRQQIGWVLVGGLMLGTLLTVFVIPFVYSRVKGAVVR